MYLPNFIIQRNIAAVDGGDVSVKNRSVENFAADFGAGLTPRVQPEEQKPEAAKPEEKPENTPEATQETTETTTALSEEALAVASWLTADDETETKPEETTPQTTSTTQQQQPNADFDAIKQKADKYEQLTQSEAFKLVDAFAASGEKDINKFINQVAGEDISKKSFDEIYDMHLRSLGMSDESRTKLLDKFQSQEPEEQELLILPIKKQLSDQRTEKLNAFLNNYQPITQTKNQEQEIPAEEKARVEALIQQGRANVKELVTGMVDKKWNGLLHVSPEMATEIEAAILENPCPIVKEGKVIGYDLKKATRLAIASNEKYFKTLLKASAEISKTAGWDEFVNKRNKPSKENTATPQNPVTRTKSQVINEHSDQAYGGGLKQPKFE